MQIALLGAGTIGALHARHLAAMDGVDRLVIADAVPGRAAQVARELGATAADSIDAAYEGADAIVIAASTEAHAPLARKALQRGLPTFVEKPVAMDLAETQELVALVEATGVPFQVGFQRRFDPAYLEARRLVESGEIGTLYLIRLIAHDATPPPDNYVPSSGALFRDSSIHDFDAIRWMTGVEVREIYAVGAARVAPRFGRDGDCDTTGAILTMTDGTLGVLSQTRHNPRGYDIRMELVGSNDAVSMGVGPHMPSRSLEPDAPPPAPGWSSFLTRFETAYKAELESFLEVASGKRPSRCTARDGLEAMRVSVAATRSVEQGQAIQLAAVA